MALTQRLEIRQSHALVMTPQLMQAIKLLQLSNLDLATYVEGELPELSPQPGVADWVQASREGNEPPQQPTLDVDEVPPADSAASRSDSEDPIGYSEWAGIGAGGRDNSDYNLEAFLPVETTLADHLAQQLALTVADPARRMIGQYLIDLVDEAGYLTGDLALVAEKLGAPLGEVDAVLAILQSFDPPGVCARN